MISSPCKNCRGEGRQRGEHSIPVTIPPGVATGQYLHMRGVGNAGTLGVAVFGLVIFGLGWGFFDCNNMPILAQIVRPEWRATGYGIMNLVSISCGGFGDWAFGGVAASRAAFSAVCLLAPAM